MERVAALQELYEAYHAESTRVRAAASPFDGVFGFGQDPKKHPCHTLFYENVEKWTDRFVAEGSQPDTAFAAASYMVEAPAQYRQTESYWYMYAAMGFVLPLIPLLKKENCKRLAERLLALYPKLDWMPAQDKIFKQLKKAGK